MESRPSAPPPKGGYRNDKVSYEPQPNPGATLITLEEVPLVEDQPLVIAPDRLPTIERGKLFAVEGIVIHPDDRMMGGAIFLQLLQPDPNKPGEFITATESVTNAKGEKGRLTYRCELRAPPKGPSRYTLKLVFQGYPPGIQVGEEPRLWKFPFAEGVLNVKGQPPDR